MMTMMMMMMMMMIMIFSRQSLIAIGK